MGKTTFQIGNEVFYEYRAKQDIGTIKKGSVLQAIGVVIETNCEDNHEWYKLQLSWYNASTEILISYLSEPEGMLPVSEKYLTLKSI